LQVTNGVEASVKDNTISVTISFRSLDIRDEKSLALWIQSLVTKLDPRAEVISYNIKFSKEGSIG